MSPFATLAAGAAMLLAFGIPVLRQFRIQTKEERRLNLRIRALERPESQGDNAAGLARPVAINAAYMPRYVRVALFRAGIAPSWRFASWLGGGLVLAGVLLWAIFGPLTAGSILACLLLMAGAVFQVTTRRRLAAFVDVLPGYLDSVRQLIMVGNALPQALVKAGETCSPAVSSQLAPLLRRIQFGAPLTESVMWLAERTDITELRMLSAAVQTNARYGGRVSTVLQNLVQILRDRARVNRELRSATAETRMSGIVLAGLPLVVGGIVAVMNPSYTRFFIATHAGHHMLLAAIGLECTGVLVMRRTMRLDF